MNKSVSPQNPPAAENTQTGSKHRFSKFFRLLKYFLLSCLILTIIEIGIAYWLISSRWHLLLTNEQMMHFAGEVNAAEPLPDNFMRVYTKAFPRHVHTTLTQQIFINYGTRFLLRHTELDQKPHCFCDMVYDIQKKTNPILEEVEWDGRLQDLEFGFGVEKYSSPEKCFDYVTAFRIAELRENLDPYRYGHLISKPLSEFTDDELIELIVLMKARGKYNPNRSPERFKKALEQFRQRIGGNQ